MLLASYKSQQYLDLENAKTYAFGKINALTIADFDQNGFLDIITFPSNFTVYPMIKPVVWLNQGTNFQATSNFLKDYTGLQYARDAILADFNGDRILDIFLIDQGFELNDRDPNFFFGALPHLIVGGNKELLWKPDESLSIPGSQVLTKAFHHIGSGADYDRDGDIDVLIATFSAPRLLENNGNGQFALRGDLIPDSIEKYPYQASGATFIKLGAEYALALGYYRMFSLTDTKPAPIILSQSESGFTKITSLSKPDLGGRERNFGVADMYNKDLNGDGREDLIILWETENMRGIDDGLSDMSGRQHTPRYSDLTDTIYSVWYQTANGDLIPDSKKKYYNLVDDTSGAGFSFSDFNNDGFIDFSVSTFSSKPKDFSKYVFINDGSGHFSQLDPSVLTLSETPPDWYGNSPFFFDANNDGKTDVVSIRGVFPNGSAQHIGEEIITYSGTKSPNSWVSLETLRKIRENVIEEHRGTQANDFIWLPNGKNFVFSSTGSDVISGSLGIDTVKYNVAKNIDMVRRANSNEIQIWKNQSEKDTLIKIEKVSFNDGSLVFDVTSANAPAAYRLYGGAFDRTPDEGGFRFWASTLDKNVALRDVAAEFISSEEFIGRYGSSLSNAAFVDALYQNVLHRGGDAGGVAHWNRMLDNKLQDRSDVLVEFTQLPEFVGISAANISNGYWVV
jgi:hypothetical protein